jgi:hypothetical protein
VLVVETALIQMVAALALSLNGLGQPFLFLICCVYLLALGGLVAVLVVAQLLAVLEEQQQLFIKQKMELGIRY